MPMRPDVFAEHAMLLSEPRAPHALARMTATLGIWNSGWPFTVAIIERPGNQPLRPPPIALLTVADGQEGWPLTPQQVISITRGSGFEARDVQASCSEAAAAGRLVQL